MNSVTFSIAKLAIADEMFSLSDFSRIKEEEKIFSENEGNEHITYIKTHPINGRFFSIYFQEGNSKPRPEKVYNTEKKAEENNPREKHQIEPNTQTFVLIDPNTQRIFISNLTKKNKVKEWLEERINKKVFIKNIINENEFVENLQSLKSIHISADKNLLTSNTGDLTEVLKYDVHSFGVPAKKATVEIEFEEISILEAARKKIRELIRQQKDEKSIHRLVVVGRTDKYFERVFNVDTIVDRTEIYPDHNEGGLFDDTDIFNKLIERIT